MTQSVFEPTALVGIQLKNRILRSATHEGMAEENGAPSETLKKLYLRIAQGGAGAIITGYAGVQQNGRSSLLNMLMIDRDELVPAYRSLVDAVHAQKTPIILQIAHCGRQTRSKMIDGETPVAPSAIRDRLFSEDRPREMTEPEIAACIENFVKAIERAKAAGFDGVQLHLAHGYLLSAFLSPATNRRRDHWGGNPENRFRIVAEILSRARARVGNFPILAKINGHEGHRAGLQIPDASENARKLEAAGCDAIEVSCGLFEDGFYTIRGPKVPVDALFEFFFSFRDLPAFIKILLKPFIGLMIKKIVPVRRYNLEAAEAIKKQVSIPVITVGGIRTLDEMNDILNNGRADFISLCRPFIIEPNIIQKLKDGKQTGSRCIDCNYCMLGLEKEPLRCYNGQIRRKTSASTPVTSN